MKSIKKLSLLFSRFLGRGQAPLTPSLSPQQSSLSLRVGTASYRYEAETVERIFLGADEGRSLPVRVASTVEKLSPPPNWVDHVPADKVQLPSLEDVKKKWSDTVIHVVDTQESINEVGRRLLDYCYTSTANAYGEIKRELRGQIFLGFDAEWYQHKPISLIQVCTAHDVYLMRLLRKTESGEQKRLVIPPELKIVFEDQRIVKTGVSILNDSELLKKYGVEMKGIVDLACLVAYVGYEGNVFGLKTMAKQILGINLPKSKAVITSDWGAPELTLPQVEHGANDARACYFVFEYLYSQFRQHYNDLPKHLLEVRKEHPFGPFCGPIIDADPSLLSVLDSLRSRNIKLRVAFLASSNGSGDDFVQAYARTSKKGRSRLYSMLLTRLNPDGTLKSSKEGSVPPALGAVCPPEKADDNTRVDEMKAPNEAHAEEYVKTAPATPIDKEVEELERLQREYMEAMYTEPESVKSTSHVPAANLPESASAKMPAAVPATPHVELPKSDAVSAELQRLQWERQERQLQRQLRAAAAAESKAQSKGVQRNRPKQPATVGPPKVAPKQPSSVPPQRTVEDSSTTPNPVLPKKEEKPFSENIPKEVTDILKLRDSLVKSLNELNGILGNLSSDTPSPVKSKVTRDDLDSMAVSILSEGDFTQAVPVKKNRLTKKKETPQEDPIDELGFQKLPVDF